VTDVSGRVKWIQTIAEYRLMLPLLCSHVDLTTDQLREFQLRCDLFFFTWLDLHGIEGITNYIHHLGSGHVSEYMQYWGNLFQHSQQGWEAFNSLLKTFYFRRTQRGGHSGTGAKTKLKPVAWWLQRRMVWMMGTDYNTIVEYTSYNRSESNSDSDDQDGDVHLLSGPSNGLVWEEPDLDGTFIV
jgi:hypothetical protein